MCSAQPGPGTGGAGATGGAGGTGAAGGSAGSGGSGASSSSPDAGGTTCGDGIRQGWEYCDGNDGLNAFHCEPNEVGAVTCDSSCHPDLSACRLPSCGNARLDDGEDCDGDLIYPGTTCASKYPIYPLPTRAQTGQVACWPNCKADIRACYAVPGTRCGNGIVEAGEQCDGPMTCQQFAQRNPDIVPAGYYTGGMIQCSRDCFANTVSCQRDERCGNGIREPWLGEDCDGTDLGGLNCQSVLAPVVGVFAGELRCTAGCKWDMSQCHGCGSAHGTIYCE